MVRGYSPDYRPLPVSFFASSRQLKVWLSLFHSFSIHLHSVFLRFLYSISMASGFFYVASTFTLPLRSLTLHSQVPILLVRNSLELRQLAKCTGFCVLRKSERLFIFFETIIAITINPHWAMRVINTTKSTLDLRCRAHTTGLLSFVVGVWSSGLNLGDSYKTLHELLNRD